MLRDGGNAIDALIAADAVLCVVYPHMTSVGGDLMAIVWPAGAPAPLGLVGAGRSGELASVAEMRSRGFSAMPLRGATTVTVPGTVEAWGRLLERFGTFGLGAVLEPAAALAKEGYLITPQLGEALQAAASWMGAERPAYALYPPMEAGMTLRNPELGALLHELGRAGINSFYRGAIAAQVVDALERRGGFVTARDLATHRSQWVEPVAFAYRDTTVYELPPPTQGLAAAAMLTRLARRTRTELAPGPGFVASFRQARDAAYALRDRFVTDPDFSTAPFKPFLDTGHAPSTRGSLPDGGDTCYLCAADEHGNLVSMIQSVAFDFGSGVVAEGTGMLLQNRGTYFSLQPSHVNRLEPRKRTMHTLIPAMAARDGRPWAAFGCMGGDGQPQIQAQVAIHLIDHVLEPAEAVARPRLRVDAAGEVLAVEADYPGAAQIAREGGAQVTLMPPRHSSFGHAHAIVVDGPGRWRAGADPRSDGSVAHV